MVSAVEKCIYHQPSILIVDDLEYLTPAVSDDEENTETASHSNR